MATIYSSVRTNKCRNGYTVPKNVT